MQGVGFRPFVYRLAREEQLGGFVRNDERGVVLEVDGRADAVESFLARLARRVAAARGRRADRLRPHSSRPVSATSSIVESVSSRRAPTRSSPPTPRPATTASPSCAIPADRRFRYPFINCTNCGPRFTIVRGVPYDRPATTMAGLRDVPCVSARVRRSRPTAASTRSRTRVRSAGRGRGSRGSDRLRTMPSAGPPAGSRRAPCWRSRGSAATTSPAAAADDRAVRRAACAQAARGPPVRADGARRRGGRGARRARRCSSGRCSPRAPVRSCSRRAYRARTSRARSPQVLPSSASCSRTRRSTISCSPTSPSSESTRSC